jgi:hypothetical protein
MQLFIHYVRHLMDTNPDQGWFKIDGDKINLMASGQWANRETANVLADAVMKALGVCVSVETFLNVETGQVSSMFMIVARTREDYENATKQMNEDFQESHPDANIVGGLTVDEKSRLSDADMRLICEVAVKHLEDHPNGAMAPEGMDEEGCRALTQMLVRRGVTAIAIRLQKATFVQHNIIVAANANEMDAALARMAQKLDAPTTITILQFN